MSFRIVRRALAFLFGLELAVRRRIRGRLEPAHWVLEGGCRGCGRCCEEPSIRVGRWLWRLAPARSLFLWWQRRVNGLALVSADDDSRTFGFSCTRFDPVRRICTDYAGRPAMCRDYPRILLDQPWPELFPGCGYRVRAEGADRLREELQRAGLDDARLAELERRLRLK